jgi:hypothetical protein
MSRKLLIAGLALAAACIGGQMQIAAAQAPADDCFRSNEVVHYTAVDRNTIRVETRNAHYLITVNNAGALTPSAREPFLLRSPNGWVCTGRGLGIDLHVGEPLRQLHIQNIARAPHEEPHG